MDSLFVANIAILFWISVIFVQAEEGLNNEQIFAITGATTFHRYHRVDIEPAKPIKYTDDVKSLLKKYLTLKSRQDAEFEDMQKKQRDGSHLSLQTSFINETHIAKNVHYEGLIYAVRSASACFPVSKGEPDDFNFVSPLQGYTREIKLEQQISLHDLEIRGMLIDDAGNNTKYNFLLSLMNPQMKATYVRIPTWSQGIVTKTLSEELTFENITMSITERGVILIESVIVSENTPIMRHTAEAWLGPIVDAIKNRRTFGEILSQSEVYFRHYIREILLTITQKVMHMMAETSSFQDSEWMDPIGDLIKFRTFWADNFNDFHVAYTEAVAEMITESSCDHYQFSHLFYMKFEAKATTTAHPNVWYYGMKKVRSEMGVEKIDFVYSSKAVHVKEVNVKFEINTDKNGEPLSMTKNLKVDLKLKIDDESPDKLIHLKMQERMARLMSEYYQETFNNLIFGSTLMPE